MVRIVGGIISVGTSNLPTSLGVYVPITLISMALTTVGTLALALLSAALSRRLPTDDDRTRLRASRSATAWGSQTPGVRERLVVLNPSRGLATRDSSSHYARADNYSYLAPRRCALTLAFLRGLQRSLGLRSVWPDRAKRCDRTGVSRYAIVIELPAACRAAAAPGHGEAARVPAWLPLTTRLERAFAARAFDLPAGTRTALLVAAVADGQRLSEVLDAAARLANEETTDLTPAVTAQLVEINGTEFRFRHPLMRTAIRQEASIAQRQAAHAALAEVLRDQPDRAVWHRAASVIGPDEAVAGELEAAARHARRRGGTALAVSALQRAADLGDSTHRAGRLLQAAELGFELGRRDLVLDLAADAEPLGLPSREQARLTWIRESFTDGIPGDAAQARALATVAGQAAADGDVDLALKLLYGASLRCWWADPGEAVRDEVVTAAERLNVDQSDPRLLVVLAFAAPIGRGAVVIDRLPRLGPAARSDAAALRLAGNAAMAVGSFEEAAGLLAAAAAGLRAQGRLGLLARALVLQAWSAVHLADLGTAIPAAAEARQLAQETRQPLIMATAGAVQAILAALRGDFEAAEAEAAQAERICMPMRASAVLAAAQLARGLACLGSGRPADAAAHLRRIHDPADPAYHYAVRCYTIGDLAEAALRSGSP